MKKHYQYEDDNYEDSGAGNWTVIAMIVLLMVLAAVIRGQVP